MAALLVPTTLVDAAVIWNEATDGLLNRTPGSTQVPAIGSTVIGMNEVIGEAQVVPRVGGNFTNFPDHFSVTIPLNQELVGLTISATADYPGDAFGGFYASASGAYDGQGNLGTWQFNSVPAVHDIFADLSIVTPLAAGTYSMNIYPLSNASGQGGTLSYTVQLETMQVPEPSAALLLCFSSFAVVLRRSRT